MIISPSPLDDSVIIQSSRQSNPPFQSNPRLEIAIDAKKREGTDGKVTEGIRIRPMVDLVEWWIRGGIRERRMEGSRTRCKSIEFDPIDQAADSLPVITRGRRSIARINHLALDRLSIPIFPRGIGYLVARSWTDKAHDLSSPSNSFVLVPLSLSLSRYIYETGLNVCGSDLLPEFFLFFLSLSCLCLSRDLDIFLVVINWCN